MFLVILLETFFSLAFVIFKKSLLFGPPFLLVALRLLLSALVLLIYQFFTAREKFVLPKKLWKLVFIVSIFNIYLTNAFELWGLQFVTAAKSAFIYNLSPFVSIILGYLFFDEKMNVKKWIGLSLGIIGFIPILFTSTGTESEIVHIGFLSVAEIALIIAAIATAIGWVAAKHLVYRKNYSVVMCNGTSMLIGGVIALVQSFFVESWEIGAVLLPLLIYTVLGAIFSMILGYNLYVYLLRRYSNTFMSFAGFTMPFITAFFGWLFLSEPVSWVFFLSASIVFVGLLFFYQQEIQINLSEKK